MKKDKEQGRKTEKLSRRELVEILDEVIDENRRLRGSRSEQASPEREEVIRELRRRRTKRRFIKTLGNTLYILVGVAALTLLIATQFLPVLRVTGTSMEPTLEDGQVVVAVKNTDFERGDIIAFYYNNTILLKRVIARAGEWVEIDNDGSVKVNGEKLYEPYISEKSLGECDIEFPYQVPDGRVFVMGDHRDTSLDSRSEQIGCVADEVIVGKVVFRVWPPGFSGEN